MQGVARRPERKQAKEEESRDAFDVLSDSTERHERAAVASSARGRRRRRAVIGAGHRTVHPHGTATSERTEREQ